MKIRKPKPTDYTAIALLLTHLGYANTTKEVQERYKILNKLEDYFSLVCVIEGVVAGYVAYTHNHYFEQSGTYTRVLALSVHPDYKRKQVGTALLEKVEEHAKKLGAK